MKKLIKKIFINGVITTQTGLHIGGSNTQIQIGGVDTAVIRNVVNDEPYIPGSSLKGKLRSLLEQAAGPPFGRGAGKNVRYGPFDDHRLAIVKLFGSAKGDENNVPSKIIVRDGKILTHDYDKNTDLPYTEVKTEIMVDRITAAASPRQIERVPAGVEFDLQIVLNVWEKKAKDKEEKDKDKTIEKIENLKEAEKTEEIKEITEKEMLTLVFNAMRLLEDDYLGGKGSRGSGQIKIGIKEIKERNNDFYFSYDPSDPNSKPFSDKIHTIPEDLQYEEPNQ